MHYLEITLPDGPHHQRYEYLPVNESTTVEEALIKWVDQHPTMIKRVRNRERQALKLRASILHARIARPTSWYDAQPAVKPRRRRRLR
jgi:hypothetical protein